MAFDDSDDDSDDDGDLESYRARMNSVKDSAGNGQPDMKMMQQRAKRVQEKTNAALANSLRIAHEVNTTRTTHSRPCLYSSLTYMKKYIRVYNTTIVATKRLHNYKSSITPCV